MSRGLTPRQLAREQTLRRIKDLALAQLANEGAAELSLRAIARELDLVSSAIYRYFASRDELLTALIVDAYADLADALEAAAASDRRGARRRWQDCCAQLRAWALAQPHRFALIYGTAIPGYQAPQDTIAPAGRVVAALLTAAQGADPGPAPSPGRRLAAQLDVLREAFATPHDDRVLLLLVGAFGRLVGLLTLELGGHFVGGFEPADDLYAALVAEEADRLGL